MTQFTPDLLFDNPTLPLYRLPFNPNYQFPQEAKITIDNRGYLLIWRYIENVLDSPETTIEPAVHLKIIRVLDAAIMFNGLVRYRSEHDIPHYDSKIPWAFMKVLEADRSNIRVVVATWPQVNIILEELGATA